MYVECEGVVVGSRPVGETSLWVRVLTAERGTMTVYARGALKSWRRTGGALDTASRTAWVIVPGRSERWLVDQADLIEAHSGLRRSLSSALRGMFLLEVARLHYASGGRLYDHLVTALAALARGGPVGRSREFLWWFVLRTMELSGHAPVLDVCAIGGHVLDQALIATGAGGTVCRACSHRRGDLLDLGQAGLAALRALSTEGGVDTGPAAALGGRDARRVGRVLRALLCWPVGGDVAMPALDQLQYLGRARWRSP